MNDITSFVNSSPRKRSVIIFLPEMDKTIRFKNESTFLNMIHNKRQLACTHDNKTHLNTQRRHVFNDYFNRINTHPPL